MLADLTESYRWARDTVGESGGAVYRLYDKQGAPNLYLKHGCGAVADDLVDEFVRLRWLAKHVRVPDVVHFAALPGEAWLLMTALPGVTAYQILEAYPDQRFAVSDMLAEFLKRMHNIPIEDCCFANDHSRRMAKARERIDAGLVDEDDFDEAREGWTAEQVWQELQELLPLTSDAVVTHGDFSLDNLLVEGGRVVGCIDTGRVGIADRYQDIAIMWNCLEEFGPAVQQRFLTSYGIASPDPARLKFHLLLDELF